MCGGLQNVSSCPCRVTRLKNVKTSLSLVEFLRIMGEVIEDAVISSYARLTRYNRN
jgi:hypothetical protein